MSSRGDDRWDERYEEASLHPWRTTLKWVLGIVAIVCIVMVVLIPFGWGFAWLSKGAEITGPQNTEEQFTALYDAYESMEATAANACAAAGTEASDQGPTFLEDPSFAYDAQYRRIQAEYDRRMRNEFEAEWLLLKPDGLPREAPTLEQMQAQVC